MPIRLWNRIVFDRLTTSNTCLGLGITHCRSFMSLLQNSPRNLPNDNCSAETFFNSPFTIQKRWKKKMKQRRSRPKSTATSEQLSIRPKKNRGWRLIDYVNNPESPHRIAVKVRQLISTLSGKRRFDKDFVIRNRHRMLRKAHYVAQTSHFNSPDVIVTPLTELQHLSRLPKTQEETRFRFPHSLHYEVYWGPPATYQEPNQTKCYASFKLDNLNLTAPQERCLIDVVGQDRYDRKSNYVILESNEFQSRNHNAAYLGDILQRLIIEVQKPKL